MKTPSKQAGATAVEFALVLLLFLMFLLGITDFARMLFTWNAATEATRAGARYAVVCDNTANKADVLAKMQALLPQIEDVSQFDLAWTPAGCTAATCEGVTLTITDLDYQWISPIPGIVAMSPFSSSGKLAMPTFKTYLSREIMRGDPVVAAAAC